MQHQSPPYIIRAHNSYALGGTEPRAVMVQMQYASEEKHRYLSQILATLAISLGPFAAGLGKGYSSPAIASLQDQFKPSPPSTAPSLFSSSQFVPSFSTSSSSLLVQHSQSSQAYRRRHRHHQQQQQQKPPQYRHQNYNSKSSNNDSNINNHRHHGHYYYESDHHYYFTPSNENISSTIYAKVNKSTFSITSQQTSWVASLSLLGALFGAMFGGLAMKFGRRNVLRATAVPFSVSWIMTMFAVNVQMIYATSFIAGFCCAIILMVSQVYISEISDPSIRGCLSAVLKIFGQLGVLLSFIMGAYLDWRQLAMAISSAPIALFFATLYLPETPSYLVLSGRFEEATRSLQWLKGGTYYEVHEELATIKNNILGCRIGHWNLNATNQASESASARAVIVERDRDSRNQITGVEQYNVGSFSVDHYGSFPDLFNKLWHPILITCGLMFFQRFSGANAFNSYAVSILRQIFSDGGMNAHGGAVAVSFVQLLASLLSGLLIDSVGRLPLLITSSMFMSIALAAFGSYAYFQEVNEPGTATTLTAKAVAMTAAAVNRGVREHSTWPIHEQQQQPQPQRRQHDLLSSISILGQQHHSKTDPMGTSISLGFGTGTAAENVYEYDWIPLLCVLIFTIAFSLGISPISWLLVGELFALEYRGLGSALALSFSYGCAFVGVKTFVDFHEILGLHGAFWLYSAVAVAGLCFVVCFVPETRGRDLQEMDHTTAQTRQRHN